MNKKIFNGLLATTITLLVLGVVLIVLGFAIPTKVTTDFVLNEYWKSVTGTTLLREIPIHLEVSGTLVSRDITNSWNEQVNGFLNQIKDDPDGGGVLTIYTVTNNTGSLSFPPESNWDWFLSLEQTQVPELSFIGQVVSIVIGIVSIIASAALTVFVISKRI